MSVEGGGRVEAMAARLKSMGLSSRPEDSAERSKGARSEPSRSGAGSSERGAAPDPEVPVIARRRRFTREDKLRVLKEAAACRAPGELGALLRREGLYSSHLAAWRSARSAGELNGSTGKQRGPKADPTRADRRELDRLERENARLKRRLEQAEAIIEVQKNSRCC
jgi:transposase-like protein